MTVFEAFPNAITRWNLLPLVIDTATGQTVGETLSVRVIVDPEATTSRPSDTTPAIVQTSTLIYAMPEDLPELDPYHFLGSFLWQDAQNRYYAIDHVAQGLNQESGVVEHMEFTVTPTEIVNAD